MARAGFPSFPAETAVSSNTETAGSSTTTEHDADYQDGLSEVSVGSPAPTNAKELEKTLLDHASRLRKSDPLVAFDMPEACDDLESEVYQICNALFPIKNAEEYENIEDKGAVTEPNVTFTKAAMKKLNEIKRKKEWLQFADVATKYKEYRDEYLDTLEVQEGISQFLTFESCAHCRKMWIDKYARLHLPLSEGLRKEFRQRLGKSPGEICDKMLKETGIDLRSLGYGYDGLAYWSTEMVLNFVTLIFHELHPRYVQVSFLNESDVGADMECRSLAPDTKFVVVVMKIQVRSQQKYNT